MAEQALYRKYRSSDFSQVIGQEHVVKTLTTAIASGRLSHAYLFTGPRGVGKTTVARLLARAINCTSQGERPCNQCDMCLTAINSSLDIIEIDAASNRSIDAVRELRDKVGLAPAIGKYKVYIIDEVHMLTTEAFNALLKTLEEPPAHAVFVLATTEAHKVPETIISRTQRFSFKPHTEANMVAQLAKIAEAEGIAVEQPALELIAAAARGGFRDAISMLDQVASSGEPAVTTATVRMLLGLSDAEAIGAMSQAIADGQAKAALEALETLIEQGAQPGQIVVQLVGQWREALLAAVGSAAADDATARALAKQLSPSRIGTVIEGLLEVARSHWPREALEVAVVRLAAAERVAEPAPAVVKAPAAEAKPAGRAKPASPAPATAPAAASAQPASEAASISQAADLWPKVLVLLKQKNNSLCALLQMYPVDFSDDTITIKSRFNFHRDLFMKAPNRRAIEEAAAKVYGRTLAVTAVTDESAGSSAGPKPSRPAVDPAAELVSSALEILGGEVVE
ncbi:MAG TPA: DNA polymerase III subunit gamma/tau [Candidatus Saccharimonadia bacterium]|nr:DNA polymerase III subunit gamma/tau [Candidatus Saccharimonadia bacterium]